MKKFLRRQKQKALILVAMITLLWSVAKPAAAFLGVGDIVYDPAVEIAVHVATGVLGSIFGVDTASLAKTVHIADMADAEYQRISAATRGGWVNVLEQLPGIDATASQVGETLGWPAMMNGTPGIAPAVWGRATVAVTPNPAIWNEEIPGMSKFLAPLATVEAIDGSASRCLDQVAQARGNWGANNPLIMSLTQGFLDASDASNGTVGQLNIGNAGLAQANAERRVQTAMQSCLNEAVVLSNKIERDHIVTAMNDQSEAMLEQTTGTTTWDGATTFSVAIP